MSYYNAFNEISKASDYIFKVLDRPSAHIFQNITALTIKNASEFLQHQFSSVKIPVSFGTPYRSVKRSHLQRKAWKIWIPSLEIDS